MSGVNYGVMIIVEEIIAAEPQETDKAIAIGPSDSLISQRDTILNELMAKKLRLQGELNAKK
jgi:hypothetical protein